MSTNRRKPTDLIEQFHAEYAEALVGAQKAHETTATDGWQQLYAEFMGENQKLRDSAAIVIEGSAETLHDRPLDTDGIKSMKEGVKAALEACEAAQSFDLQTVRPIRSTVERLHQIIAEYEGKANSAAQSTPLHDSDVVDQMAEAIASVAKATWNPRVGTIALTMARTAS